MPTSRPFAYNTGANIPGTDQVGNLAIGYPTSGFESTGLQWWAGPDEDSGYVIGKPAALNSQPTPVPDDALTLSTTYKGADIQLSNNNQTAYQAFGYQMSVLAETLIDGAKVMFSVKSTSLEPSTLPQSRFIGAGQTSMNYQGTPYGGYPGNDTKSIGFNAIGEYYYAGNVVQSGLPTWTTGDIIDIAISRGEYWWIRVNGGNWNGNPSANPTTPSDGLTMNSLTNYYPALCPGYEGTMTVLNYPPYGVPADYNFLGNVSASVGFSRSSALTDPSFISIANAIAGPSGPFASASNAKTWLNANGYWTSYEGATGSTGATGFTVTLVESGSNVVMTASGSLNINDLTLVASATGPFGSGGIGVNSATWLIGSGGEYVDQYSGFSSTPSNFGGGGGAGASSITGDVIGVVYNGGPPYLLTVPVGYTTGTQLTASQTFSSQSFASMGLVEGTYTYAWGAGLNADSINVVVGGTGATGSTGGTGGAGGTGDFNVTITQVGNDVVWSGSGSFNLTALTSAGGSTIGGGYQANQAVWAIGPITSVDTYSGTITYPPTFGGGGTGVTSNTGSAFGILPGGSGRLLYVPSGYTSNSVISGTSTYANTTIAGMGLTLGTYTWSWGSAPNTSTLVMVIG
jgi:hypothetical protein